MSNTYELTTTSLDNVNLQIGDVITCAYSGEYKTLTLPKGTYLFECYGAQGGSIGSTFSSNVTYSISSNIGGLGGKVNGKYVLKEETCLFLFVGGQGEKGSYSNSVQLKGGWNGGGATSDTSKMTMTMLGASGGGASDIRLSENLEDQIIVAGGGGGAVAAIQATDDNERYARGGAGGGTIAGDGLFYKASMYTNNAWASKAGTQESGGAGSTASLNVDAKSKDGSRGNGGDGGGIDVYTGGGGGGGYYGGGGGIWDYGSVATYPYICSGAGGSSYTSEDFTEVIHEQGVREGDGFIQITVIELDENLAVYLKKNNEILKSKSLYCKANNHWHAAKSLYAKVNGKWELCGIGNASSNVFKITDENGNLHEYYFETGMSWEEFVDSSYNDGNFSFDKAFRVEYTSSSEIIRKTLSYRDKLVLVKNFNPEESDLTVYIIKKSAAESEAQTSNYTDINFYIKKDNIYDVLLESSIVPKNVMINYQLSDGIKLEIGGSDVGFKSGSYVAAEGETYSCVVSIENGYSLSEFTIYCNNQDIMESCDIIEQGNTIEFTLHSVLNPIEIIVQATKVETEPYVIFSDGAWRDVYEEGSMCGWYGLSGSGDLGDNNYFEENVKVYGSGYNDNNRATGFIIVCYNTSSKDYSTGFDFGKYNKIGMTLKMVGTSGLIPGGIGYIDSVTEIIGNAVLTSASDLGLASGVGKTVTVDISEVTGEKFIAVRSPYFSDSYVQITKIWLE